MASVRCSVGTVEGAPPIVLDPCGPGWHAGGIEGWCGAGGFTDLVECEAACPQHLDETFCATAFASASSVGTADDDGVQLPTTGVRLLLVVALVATVAAAMQFTHRKRTDHR